MTYRTPLSSPRDIVPPTYPTAPETTIDEIEPGTLFMCKNRPLGAARVVYTKLGGASNHHNAKRIMPLCRETERISLFESVSPILDPKSIALAVSRAKSLTITPHCGYAPRGPE